MRKTQSPKRAPTNDPSQREFSEGVSFTRTATVRSEDVEENDISLSFSSESPVRDFWGPPVVLLHEPNAVDTSRLNSMLLNHSPDRILGAVRSITIDEETRRGRAVARFDEDADAQLARSKVASGSLRGVSVSYVATKAQRVGDGEKWKSPGGREFKGPVVVATRWQPIELSLTPIPADSSVGVGRVTQPEEERCSEMDEALRALLVKRGMPEDATDEEALAWLARNRHVLETDDKPEPETRPSTRQDSERERLLRDDAIRSERGRIEEIDRICSRGQIDDDQRLEWITSGRSIDQISREALDLAFDRQTTIEPTRRTRIETGEEPLQRAIREMDASLSTRLRVEPDDPQCRTDEYVPLIDIYKRLVYLRGHHDAMWFSAERLLQGARASFSHATGDFTSLLENSMRKVLRRAYQEASGTFEPWTRRTSLSDFKAAKRVNLGQAPNFTETPDLAPIGEITVGDTAESIQLATYAQKFSIGRQTLINDDLDGFSRMFEYFGAAARRTINHGVYDHLTGTVTMAEDSKSLFATDHTSGSNLAGTAAEVSTAGLAEGRKLMRLQKGLAGSGTAAAILNLVPRFLIVPAAQEQKAEELMVGMTIPVLRGTSQDVIVAPTTAGRSLQMIVEPYLDGKSAKAWYLAANPNQVDTIQVARLNNQTAPVIQRLDGHDVLGVSWVAYFDFGVRAIDHRGLYKNAGE